LRAAATSSRPDVELSRTQKLTELSTSAELNAFVSRPYWLPVFESRKPYDPAWAAAPITDAVPVPAVVQPPAAREPDSNPSENTTVG